LQVGDKPSRSDEWAAGKIIYKVSFVLFVTGGAAWLGYQLS
jgi:hypothetical protein